MAASHKVIAISQWWAGIFATLFCTAIIGGVAYAWDDNAEKAAIRTKLEAVERSDLPNRMTRIEVRVENTNDSVARVEMQQKVIDEKIDKIIEKIGAR